MLCGRFCALDHAVIGGGRRTHGLLHETEEELATAFRPPAIEAKREFVQIIVEMTALNATLKRSEEPSLQKGGNPVDLG